MLKTFTVGLVATLAVLGATVGAGVANADTDADCTEAQAALVNADTSEQAASAAVATAVARRAATTNPFAIFVDDARVRYTGFVEARAAARVTRAQAAVTAACGDAPAVVITPPPLINADLGIRLGLGTGYRSDWR